MCVCIVWGFCDLAMTVWMMKLISLNWGNNIGIKFIKLLICIIISPITPTLIYILKRYHSHPKIKSFLNKLKIMITKNLFDANCNLKYEKQQNNNLKRWLRIQKWRYASISIQTYCGSFLTIIAHGIALKDRHIPFHLRLLCLISIFLSIIAISLNSIIVQFRPIAFIQTYWTNVLMTGRIYHNFHEKFRVYINLFT